MALTLKPRICIFGAGAIGGWVGAKLHHTGNDVTLVARGAHKQAISDGGLVCIANGEETIHEVPVTDEPMELPEQDIVFVTAKAHSIPPVADSLRHLIGEQGVLVTAVNGLPWWYFYGIDSPYANKPILSVDPDRALWNHVGPDRTIGCVVYPSVDMVKPGVLNHTSDNRLPLGEPTGESTERIQQVSQILEDSGFRAPIRRNIRNEIWLKLWGNVAFNPVSVLTGALLDEMATDAGTRDLAATLMQEVRNVGEKLGVRFGMSIEKRIQGAAQVGAHKTSMLQDFESGKQLESGAIIDAVIEVADLVQVPTPAIHMINALLKQRVKIRDSSIH